MSKIRESKFDKNGEESEIERSDFLRFVRRVFVGFLQGLFSYAPKNTFKWHEDPSVTEIMIQNEGRLDPETVYRTPFISVSRSPVSSTSFGYNDQDDYSFQTGAVVKRAMFQGNMAINCCSKADLESEQIAWLVCEYIWILNQILKDSGVFDVGQRISIGAITPAKAIISNELGNDIRCTPVYVPWMIARAGSSYPLNAQTVSEVRVRVLEDLEIYHYRVRMSQALDSTQTNNRSLTTGRKISRQDDVGTENPMYNTLMTRPLEVPSLDQGAINQKMSKVPKLPHPSNPNSIRNVVRRKRG